MRPALVALLCVLPYFGFWFVGLFDLDEGFYGAVTRDMLSRGDWITPTLNGEPWFEKPILLYWAAIPSVAAFGEWFGPRFPSVLATLATCALLRGWARKAFGENVGDVVAVAYAAALLPLAIGRLMITDALLTLALTSAFVLFWKSLTDGTAWHRVGAGACVGVGILAKGPVAGLLFGAAILVFFWRFPEFRPKYRGGWPLGIAAFAAVVATWYLPAYLVNGEAFVQGFLIEQNVGRFTGGDVAHRVPFWSHPIYFPAVILLGLSPWTAWGWGAFKELRTPVDDERRALRGYLWIWALVVVGFFTLSGSKLVHYVLPAAPALAILLVEAAMRRRTDQPWFAMAGAWSALAFALATAGFAIDYENRFREVHAMALYARDLEGTVVEHATSGERPDGPEIKLELDETSHPSLGFYVGRLAVTRSVEDLDAIEGTAWVITRAGRITDQELGQLALRGRFMEQVETPFEQRDYRLFRLDPLRSGPSSPESE